MRGELPLPQGAKPWTPSGMLNPARQATGNDDGLSATCEPTEKRGWERRYHHVLFVVDRDGKQVDYWPQHDKLFEHLPGATQDEILKALEKGQIELPSLSSRLFFDILWRNTEEGFFADPMYGGNRGKVGWKLIGFPGVASGAYNGHLENPELYQAEPVSILDIETKQAQVDGQGYAKHIMLKQVRSR